MLAGSVLASPAMAASTTDVSVQSTTAPAATTFELSGFFIEQKESNFEEITRNLSDEELALLESGEPAVVYQKAETAGITKVEKKSDVQTYALLPTTHCASTTVNACLYGGSGASVDYGFIGTGSLTGTWKSRVKYGSQNRTMRACGTVCYATVGPKVMVQLDGPTTIKSVTVY